MQNLTVLESASYRNSEELKIVCAEYTKNLQPTRRCGSLPFESLRSIPFDQKTDLRSNTVHLEPMYSVEGKNITFEREVAASYDGKVLNEQNARQLNQNGVSSLPQKEKAKRDRKVLHPQAKELILNVVNFMKQEANGEFVVPPRRVQCRAAMATGFSERTVRRVVKESKTLPITENANGESSTVVFPPKKIPNRPKPKTGLDALTRCAVRKIIHRIYVNEKTVPTIKKIHQRLVEELAFKGGSRSAHKIVKELGFYWKKTKAKSYVLMEKHDIRLKRIEFLRDITRLRHEGRPVVYVEEGQLSPGFGSTNWASTIIAGGERGCVPGTLLVVEGSDVFGNVSGWVRDGLSPALHPGSVVVFDASSRLISSCQDRVPTLDCDAETMKKWLLIKGIPHRPDMLRPELHQLIRRNAGRMRKHKGAVEQMLVEAGHTVLRIPPEHPDLSAAALIWADIRRKLIDGSVSTRVFLERRLEELGTEAWAARCAHVRAVEQQYLASEGIVDAEVERVLAAGKESVTQGPEPVDDLHDNNISFVRHFMGGLLGLDDHKSYADVH